jgi:general transcription factor 3C polypeptide 3 (transcription factor C subunit 4)
MAFLSKYRNLRGENTQGTNEVEYNFGRMFQQLGWFLFLFLFQPSHQD